MKIIDEIEKRALSDIENTDSIEKIKELKNNYFGKSGQLSVIFKSFSNLSVEEKTVLGKKANQLKAVLEQKIIEKENFLKKESGDKSFDPTIPGNPPKLGNLHPITLTCQSLIDIFSRIGFSIVQGPDVETVWYNFDALNFPKEHPAREMQDTLFVSQDESEKEELLMRTHTSPVQVRYMKENKPPFKIIVPGRVYRNEATDASHEINFYQLEGLMVGQDISVANFKAVITDFINSFFKEDLGVRFRPSFFPFTEPSFEVDMQCTSCAGKGCSVCSRTGWIEVFGSGMVHPNVLKNCGIDPTKWQGFAFGMGVDRLAMIKYGINEVRLSYGNDLRFLKQFY